MKLDSERNQADSCVDTTDLQATGEAILSRLSQLFGVSHRNHSTIRAMEGLRGFAAFLVFLVHYDGLIAPFVKTDSFEYYIGRLLWNIGNAGVDLFFVLSGYLIYRMLMKKNWQFKEYFLRRLQRIYPTFLAVFGLYLVLSVLFPAENKIPRSAIDGAIYIIENVLLLPGLFDIRPMLTVAWSLSYEMFFYLLTPLVIVITCMTSWPRRWRVVLFLTISLIGFCYNGFLHGGHVQLLMFIAGMLLYEVIDSNAVDVPPRLGLWALLVAIISMPILEWDAWRYVVLYVCFFLLCLDSFSANGLTRRIFSWLPLRWYGNMSYSYYLVHGLSLKAIFTVVGVVAPIGAWPGISLALLVPIFLITLIPAVLLFAFVEKPYSLSPSLKVDMAVKARTTPT